MDQVFTISSKASAELVRQSACGDTPGIMNIDFIEDTCSEGWVHIRVGTGRNNGVPIARTDGVTLYAPEAQVDLLKGLELNFYADLSGGGFLISVPTGSEACSCGAGFRKIRD
ncbi:MULTISPECIES: AIR synthase [Prochlorococcus]|uniref:AIR synthase n=1 Tax=Prochlorococcus TaxID=1218 RepID=UPI00055CEC62|nr:MULTISPECIES: AIR synthase [Prochlorococcus]